ncbi:hypothetical protein N9W41_01035 [bacterium]|nr:hypothetical protein [bacterium]
MSHNQEDTCEGSGAKKGTSPETCTTCGGAGQVVRQQGFFQMQTSCPDCAGQGQVIKEKCGDCHGRGRVTAHRKIEVKIPAGVETGNQLRLSAEGEGGHRGGPRGDLYVVVDVEEHDVFDRQDTHLVAELKISYLQALLGAQIEFEGLDDIVDVVVTPGTATDDLITIKEKGLPSLRHAKRGNLVLQAVVEIPKKLSKKEEELLREIAEAKGESVADKKSGLFGF